MREGKEKNKDGTERVDITKSPVSFQMILFFLINQTSVTLKG